MRVTERERQEMYGIAGSIYESERYVYLYKSVIYEHYTVDMICSYDCESDILILRVAILYFSLIS